jgi:prophage antirepressor-like protein
VINLLDDITIKKNKYYEYKNEIELYDIRDNEYGGFYIKEFINQETFYKILLHSNSNFAKKFKEDISKILDELTNQGKMILSNNKIILSDSKKPIEYLKEEYKYTQTYENDYLLNFVKEKIRESKKMNWNKYMNRHVMYFFIITLDDPKKLKRILAK